LRPSRNPSRPPTQRTIKRLVGERIGPTVQGTRHMARTPMREARQALQRFVAERGKFGVAHTPATLQLLHDKLAIKKEINLTRAELGSEVDRSYHGAPLSNVIRGRADRCGD
jgi:hypothetical protein